MRGGRVWLTAAMLLVVFAALCGRELRWDTPTVDEFAHLPAGYHYLQTGRFDLFSANPPLVKILCALPLLALQPAINTAVKIQNTGWFPWILATDFMERNRDHFDRIFFFGRLPVVVLGLLLSVLVFLWARDLYGDEAGLVALFFTVFCPSIIAHAHLATIDVGLTGLVVFALYLFSRLMFRPSPGRLIACGIVLGIAQFTKFTALLLYPLFVLLALIVWIWGKRFPGYHRWSLAGTLGSLTAVFLLSLLALDAAYLFQGVGRPVGAYPFESRMMQTVTSFLPAGLPLPLPSPWVEGSDQLQLINDQGEYPEYLFGQWSPEGSKAYYLVTLLFKTPLPLLLAWVLAPAVRAPGRRGREIFVWLPAVILFVVFSLFSRVHYGIRYVLPVVPLATIWSARLVPWVRERSRATQAVAAVLLLSYPLSALLATSGTLSYFNLLAAGQGERILLDSNLDWGQGLKRVRAYMDREGLQTIDLAYFGHVDPAIYGIAWHFPRPDRPGLVAVSANFLHGYPYATYAGGHMVAVPAGAFTWLAKARRVADLGGGMLVYQVAAPKTSPSPR
ncbi:MAG TPA: glycosyltransferase family 39 protein [Candidatus Methylomirabilis sp.]|nr:glycosyltransferase family 39 protein [Candidatus Methylomirabilis sp.]